MKISNPQWLLSCLFALWRLAWFGLSTLEANWLVIFMVSRRVWLLFKPSVLLVLSYVTTFPAVLSVQVLTLLPNRFTQYLGLFTQHIEVRHLKKPHFILIISDRAVHQSISLSPLLLRLTLSISIYFLLSHKHALNLHTLSLHNRDHLSSLDLDWQHFFRCAWSGYYFSDWGMSPWSCSSYWACLLPSWGFVCGCPVVSE